MEKEMAIILGSYGRGSPCIKVQKLHLDQYLETTISKSQNQGNMKGF